MKKLFIDLEICYKCKGLVTPKSGDEGGIVTPKTPQECEEGGCKAQCDYYFHPNNDGVSTIIERASRMLVCRQCEAAPCVAGCVFDALEKQEDGKLKRYSMRCTGCQTCSLACPFGVVYPQIVPYITSQCDYCLGSYKEGEEPLCVKTCPEGAIKYIEVEESEKDDIYLIGEHLAVHSIPWGKE